MRAAARGAHGDEKPSHRDDLGSSAIGGVALAPGRGVNTIVVASGENGRRVGGVAIGALCALLGLLLACTGEVIVAEPTDEAMSAASDDEVAQTAPVSSCTKPHAQGRRCDDGLFCTVNDRCDDGVCKGEPRACADAASFCETPVCDESQDACVATPIAPTCEDRCAGERATTAYQRGFRRGWKSVQRAWDRHGDDCDETEAFVDRVTERIEHAQQRCDADDDSTYRRCRIAGATAGAFAALEQIQLACDDRCMLDGELVGQVAATTYCELAIGGAPLEAEAWVRGPLNQCGLQYEVACDSSFIGTSIDYANPQGQCEPFTEGAFATVWDRTRLKACDYQNRTDASP